METERLFLRPYSPLDFEDYYSYIMDSELQYMLGLHDVTDRSSAQKTFQWLMDNRRFLAVVLKETGHAIGHICIHPPISQADDSRTWNGKSGESLSFAISKDYRRRGLMEEALRILIESLFKDENLGYIECEYTSFNHASSSLQRKLGFVPHSSQQIEDFTLYTCILLPLS